MTHRLGAFEVEGFWPWIKTTVGAAGLIGVGAPVLSQVAAMSNGRTPHAALRLWARATTRFLDLRIDITGINHVDPAAGHFTHVQHDRDNPRSLTHNNVVTLFEDPTRPDVLWIGTSDGGVNRFDRATGTFTALQHDPNDPTSVFILATALAEHLMPTPLDILDLNTPSDGFAGDLDNNPIPDEFANGPAYALDLAKIFLLGQLPWYEWRLDHPLAPAVLMFYARNLAQLPEFQLT